MKIICQMETEDDWATIVVEDGEDSLNFIFDRARGIITVHRGPLSHEGGVLSVVSPSPLLDLDIDALRLRDEYRRIQEDHVTWLMEHTL